MILNKIKCLHFTTKTKRKTTLKHKENEARLHCLLHWPLFSLQTSTFSSQMFVIVMLKKNFFQKNTLLIILDLDPHYFTAVILYQLF